MFRNYLAILNDLVLFYVYTTMIEYMRIDKVELWKDFSASFS
jgi:hypothetical protein